MSSFNKEYLNDKEMENLEIDSRRKRKMQARKMKNRMADQIFKGVIDKIAGGTLEFTKEEMIQTAPDAEGRVLSRTEWPAWEEAWRAAKLRLDLYYWGNGDTPAKERRMFSFVRNDRKIHGGKALGRYYLVPITRSDDSMSMTNLIYESKLRRMRGLADKLRQIKTSSYRDMLETDDGLRKELIKDLQKKLLSE